MKKRTARGRSLERFVKGELVSLVGTGFLGHGQKLNDGEKNVGGGKVAHVDDQPADFFGWGNLGLTFLIECKETNERRLRVHNDLKDQNPGLKVHQRQALLNVQSCGGLGLLIVMFESRKVYAVDGDLLEKGIADMIIAKHRHSLPLEWFQMNALEIGINKFINLRRAMDGSWFPRRISDPGKESSNAI